MNKQAVSLLVLAVLLVPVAAVAQDEDLRERTSLAPLQQVIEGYAAGDSISDSVQQNPDESPITSTLQFLVNLGSGPAFVEPDLGLDPSGTAASQGSDIVSLSEFFPGPFNQIPPLHPWGTNQGAADISSLFPDWSAFGEDGPIDGPVEIVEPPTLVWGIELAEPFDVSCEDSRTVGRSWMGEGLTSSEAPFTAEDLSNAFFDDDRSALANGENTRLIELACTEGGEPTVLAARMNPDLGRIRGFGPTEIVAIVKDSYVVFFTTLRTLGLDRSDIPSFLYANDPGGPVVPYEPDGDFPALVPNVYDEFPDHIEITMDIPEDEAGAPSRPGMRDLLLRSERPQLATIGTGGCPPATTDFFANWVILGAERAGLLWGRGTSTTARGKAITLGGDIVLKFEFELPNGQLEVLTINPITGAITTETEECTGTGRATVNGEAMGSESGDGEPATGGEGDTGDTEADVEPVFSDDSGVPWWLIGLAIVLVGGLAIGITRTRSRTRVRDCQPEIEAWEAAVAAHAEAKRTFDYWQGEWEHWSGLRAETEHLTTDPLGEPNRELGYPDTPDGQAAYERDLADWQERQAAKVERAEELELYREKAAVAETNLAEAKAALDTASDLVWQAQIALQNCQGSAPPLPPGVQSPPPPPPKGQPQGCTKGAIRWIEDKSVAPVQFLLADEVSIRVPTAPWSAFAPNGKADPKELYAMTEAAALDLLRDLDQRDPPRVRPDVSILLVRVTVTCEKQQECDASGAWIDTGQHRNAETRAGAGSIPVPISTRLDSVGLSRFIGMAPGSASDAVESGEAVERGKLKTALDPYMKTQQEYEAYTCH